MDHQKLKELLPFAALDTLDLSEKTELDSHLAAGCAECASELREFREAAGAMASSTMTPSIEDRIWRRLQSKLENPAESVTRIERFRSENPRRIEPKPRSPRFWQAVSVISLAAALIIAFLLALRSRDLAVRDGEIASLRQAIQTARQQLAQSQTETASLRTDLEARTRLTRAMLAPDLELVKLVPVGAIIPGSGLVVLSPMGRTAMLAIAGLPVTPEGRTYELWWLGAKRGPIPGGLFRSEPGRETIAMVNAPPVGERVAGSAVTLEPGGGSPSPTGAILLRSLAPPR